MTINNWQAFKSSIWNWAPLKPCFTRGIEPTDIDGWVEIGGYFLVLEGKAPNVPLKHGQRLTFERMQRWNEVIPRLFTIIVIWGDAEAGRIERLQFWPTQPFQGGWDELNAYVRAWSVWAESGGEQAATQKAMAPVVVAHREVQRVDLKQQQAINATQMDGESLLRNLNFARSNRDDANCRQWVEVLEAEQARRAARDNKIQAPTRGTT